MKYQVLFSSKDSNEMSSLIFSEKKKEKYSRVLSVAVVIGALKVKTGPQLRKDLDNFEIMFSKVSVEIYL